MAAVFHCGFGFDVFVSAAKFLLWVGIVILVIAIIVGLMRYIRRGA